MNIYKNTIISGVSILTVGLIFISLPLLYVSIIFITALTVAATYLITQNYDINYKYWFSFISQLVGLLLIVASFVLMMLIIFNGLYMN